MKITILVAMIIAGSTAMAQNTTTAPMPDTDTSSKGFRVSAIKAPQDYKIEFEYEGYKAKNKNTLDSNLGIAIGYAHLPSKGMLFTTNLAYFELRDAASANFARLDGNLGYAFNQHLHLKGGLNTMKATSPNSAAKAWEARLGYQMSLGVQLNKNVGLDIGYTETNMGSKTPVTDENDEEVGQGDLNLKISGAEIGLNVTF